MGNAFVVGATDPETLFVNPSFGGQLRGMAIASNRHGGAADGALAFSAAAGVAWWRGAVGIGVRTADASAAATLGYAMAILGVRLGAAASILEQRVDDARGHGIGLDVGTSASAGFLSIGVAARNLGPALTLSDADETAIPLPERFALNLATRAAVVGPLDVTLAAAGATNEDGEWNAGAGIEAAYWPMQGRTFALRTGVHRGEDHTTRITVGAGFRGDDLGIDWGWLEGVHRIGLSWR